MSSDKNKILLKLILFQFQFNWLLLNDSLFYLSIRNGWWIRVISRHEIFQYDILSLIKNLGHVYLYHVVKVCVTEDEKVHGEKCNDIKFCSSSSEDVYVYLMLWIFDNLGKLFDNLAKLNSEWLAVNFGTEVIFRMLFWRQKILMCIWITVE